MTFTWRGAIVWLVKVLGRSFIVNEDTIHATDEFEKEWTVVEAQYYSIERDSHHGQWLQASATRCGEPYGAA
jgi:hypothetical protein